MKVVAFLPAKGTSERIESKNMKLLNGKPLFLCMLEKLCKCDFIDEVYLDSESDEILNYAPFLRYIPLKRDSALASNKTDGHQMFYNEVRQVEADIYIQILCTSPFIKPETIQKGVEILKEHDEYDSVVLVKKEKEYLWENGQPSYDKFHVPNSNTLPDTITESMGLYIVRKETACTLKMRYGNHVFMLTGDAVETIDVNYPDEFELAETIMKGLQERENARLNLLGKFMSSAIYADILSDMGVESVITGMKLNLENRKVFGRANTLKIRKLSDSEDYRGIYDGLKTYKRVTPGEILVVENEIGDRAYFGELNAHLAVRAGALGTIIGGMTRDISEVTCLDYPVWAEGYCCVDVKYKATVESHQMPVSIHGIEIVPGDLIFADNCGIVRIPQELEQQVLERATQMVETEKSILKKVMQNQDAYEIYQTEGEF